VDSQRARRIDNARAVLDRLSAWPVRVLWLPLPLTAGVAFADALHDTSDTFRTAVSVGLWVAWGVILLATFVPHPLTLTAIRIAMPAAPVAVGWALTDAPADAPAVAGLVLATLAAGAGLLVVTGDVFVDGASYGAERRFGLRVPAALLLGPIELTWAVTVAGLTAGPLLLAAGEPLGVLALIVGLPAAALGSRAIHGLHRRWLVFVPAGLVVHDLATLADPLLLVRSTIERIGPEAMTGDAHAPGDPPPSFGLPVHIALREPVTSALAGAGPQEIVSIDRLVVHPGRPGAVISEAAVRGLPVG
jgi:hypothetical protein